MRHLYSLGRKMYCFEMKSRAKKWDANNLFKMFV